MRFLPRLALFFCSWAVAFFGLAGARAHQPGLSTIFVELGTNRIKAQLIVSWQDLEQMMPLDANHDKTLSDEEFKNAEAGLARLGETTLSLESDGRMLSLKSPVQVQREDTTGIRFDFIFEFPSSRVLTLTSEIIAELQRGHREMVIVRNAAGATLAEDVLERGRPTIDVPLSVSPESGNRSPVRQFLAMGLEHILTGWDHLAFLFGLLVIGGRLRDAVKIITSFTLAHSLTLALATLNLISIPSRIVEPLIAASIVYVGFENIVRDNFSKRWMLTFAFGLIHGCGFASALREAGVGANGTSVVAPLVCFNVGVELGQLAIAAIMLPIIWKLKPVFPKRWLPITSVALILIGSYFLVERVWPGISQARTEQSIGQVLFSSASMKSTKPLMSARCASPAASLRCFNRSCMG